MRLSVYRRRMRARIGRMIVFAIMLAAVSFAVYTLYPSSDKKEAREAVEQFYKFEQIGNFGGSWEMFHPQMKSVYPKESYIQQRAKVLMHDFGAQTFDFKLGTTEMVTAWSLNENTPLFEQVYKIPVTQTFQGIFGVFSIVQDVYVAKEQDKWTILWPFSLSQSAS